MFEGVSLLRVGARIDARLVDLRLPVGECVRAITVAEHLSVLEYAPISEIFLKEAHRIGFIVRHGFTGRSCQDRKFSCHGLLV